MSAWKQGTSNFGVGNLTQAKRNIDPDEQRKFDSIAASWWDPEGESRPLHDLNPARLRFIDERANLAEARAADVGCGGGILSEALAGKGAVVSGIDIAGKALAVARLHLHESGQAVEYLETTAEDYADENPSLFDVVTCMEMLEHVPDPFSVVRACSAMLKPGGQCFLSTLNRTPAAFLVAIVGGEHVMRVIPQGTHQFDKFIRPSELGKWLRAAGLEVREVTGIHYNPVSRSVRIGGHVRVNYLVHATKPGGKP
jgi:2-polyprenyl-6-hydroxyphenyl methylase/3-demethylubiquinone-9 3-methyltransferase